MKLRNKLLTSLLAAYFALIPVSSKTELGRYAKLLPQGYSEIKNEKTYRTQFKTNNYSGTLVHGPKSAWFVYDTSNQEIIGDQQNEKEDYSKLALTFEIERFDSLNPNFPKSLMDLSENIRIGLLQYETTYKIPMFVLENGSRLEGILIGAIHTGGANLPTQVQAEFIKSITNQESERIKNKFFKSIKLKEEDLQDPDKIIEVTKTLKSFFENTLEFRIIESRKKLEKAADLFEKYNSNWNYESANDCFNALVEGYVGGKGSLNYINDLMKVDWKLISKKIASHAAEGYAGVPAEQIFDFPEIQNIVNNYKLYLEKELKLFLPMIGRFDLYDQESAASLYLNSNWNEPQQQNSESQQVILNFINTLKNKNLEYLIQDNKFIVSEYKMPGVILASRNNQGVNIEEVKTILSNIYLCNKLKLTKLPNDDGYEVFYLKPESKTCSNILTGDCEYRGEIFYLKKENNSFKIAEIIDLSKQGLRLRAEKRLNDLVISAISYYAENGSQNWPRPFSEPKIIPDFYKNPLGSQCNIQPPYYSNFPSKNRCFFSYSVKSGKVNEYDNFIIEATGNLDEDPSLEIIQMGVGSKQIRYLRRD